MDIEEVQQKLGKHLASDFEHGPFSDTPFVRAEVEADGMLSLFDSRRPDQWPVASFDVPQLAAALMPLIRRAQAEALRKFRADLIGRQFVSYGIVLPDISEVVDDLDERADRIEQEAGA